MVGIPNGENSLRNILLILKTIQDMAIVTVERR